MKAHTHTLHSEAGERGGVWDRILFSVLKQHADRPEIKRVEKVLTLLVASDRHAREQLHFWHRSEDKDWGKSGMPAFMQESLRASRHTLQLLDTALRRYRWGAHVEGGTGGFLIIRHTLPSAQDGLGRWEAETVGMLLDVARKPEELSRFRRCSECEQWFYAITGHQKFCDEPCRRLHTAHSPEFKEKRARYMREIYRPIIQPREDARAKQQAGFSKKSKKGGK